MRDTVKAAKVGALVVGALIAAFVVWRAVDERSSQDRGYRVWASFEDAQGLITKSRVVVAGIPVGHIESIRLEGDRARIDMFIRADVTLYRDATVAKRSASLLGESLLAIHPGSPEEPEVEDGQQIMVEDSTPSTADIMTDVGAVARSVRAVAAQVERTFGTDEGGQQMQSALRNLTEALEAVNRTIQANEQAVGATVRNVEGITERAAPRLDHILANIETVTRDLRDVVERNEGSIDQGVGEVGPTIASINRAAQELETVLQDVGEVTHRTAEGEGTIGRLTSDDHLINEVEDAVEGVGDIIGTIGRLQTIVGLRSEYNFLSNSFKNYLEIRLQTTEDRYFFVQLIDDPRGNTQFTTRQVRRSPPFEDQPQYYEEVVAETTESLLFTIQLAKRIYFATLRFGILESSGGLGLDLHFFDDSLELNFDLFRFGDSAFPRLRIRVAYEIVQTLSIVAGVDDILNERSTDFFLGAMLRFNDQDLVSILPFLGSAGAAL